MFLAKHHGLGNDFLVVLDERNDRAVVPDGAPVADERCGLGGETARVWCDRRRGIGADGLIHGARPSADQAAAGIDVVMHLFNRDGSRAEMSGNGVRCLGQAVARARGLVEGTVSVLTDAGPRVLEVRPGPDPDTVEVSVSMGRPRPGPHVPEPVAELLAGRYGTVDMGNPHLVIVVDDPDLVDLTTEGHWLEQQFPHGVNVEYIAPAAGGTRLRLRVWERGAGVTEACGTGACASVHLAHHWGLVGDRVRVSMPGGDAEVDIEPDGTVTLIGPSVHIADIEIAAGSNGSSWSAARSRGPAADTLADA